MKVVAFNGSPKSEGNTYHAIKLVGDELVNQGIDMEIVHVGDKVLAGCVACGACTLNRNERCIKNDQVNEWIQLMKDADGIILGSPVHFSNIGAAMKAFLDRAFYVGANHALFRHKVGVAVVADRRAGALPTFDQLNHYLQYAEMFIPSSNYWNVIFGRTPGEVLQDDEGRQIMRVLGRNMAYLLKLIEYGKEKVDVPESEKKILTNYIR